MSEEEKIEKIMYLFSTLPLNLLYDTTMYGTPKRTQQNDDDTEELIQIGNLKQIVCSVQYSHLGNLLRELSYFVSKKSRETLWLSMSVLIEKILFFLRLLFVHGGDHLKILGTQLYLDILIMKHSVWDVFLYQRALQTLKMWTFLHDVKGKVHKMKSTKQSSNTLREKSLSDTKTDRKAGLDHLKVILSCLVKFLEGYSLEQDEEMMFLTIEVLGELTRFTSVEEDKSQTSTLSTLHSDAYRGLRKIASSTFHDSCDRIMSVIFKNLLPNIIMSFVSVKSSASVPHSIRNIHNTALRFVMEFIDKNGNILFRVVRSLLQHMCVGVPELSEYRLLCEEAVVKILSKVPEKDISLFVIFLKQYARNKKSVFRLSAVNISAQILLLMCNNSLETVEIKIENESISEENQTNCQALLSILYDRLSDKTSSVRSKALSKIAELFDSTKFFEKFRSEIEQTLLVGKQNSKNSVLMDLVSILKRRLNDQKCSVRKSALQLLIVLIRRIPEVTADGFLHHLQDSCYDPSISIRKQAITTLSDLLREFPNNLGLIEVWATVVPKFVFDGEASLQEKALENFKEIVFSRLRDFKKGGAEDTALWFLLERLDHGTDIVGAVTKACSMILQKSPVSKNVIEVLEAAIGVDNDNPNAKQMRCGAWIMMSHLAPFVSQHISYQIVVRYWERVRDTEVPENLSNLKVLSTLGHVAASIPEAEKSKLIDDFIARLTNFSVDPRWIQPYIQTLVKLGDSKTITVSQWTRTLLTCCTEVLGDAVLPGARDRELSSSQENSGSSQSNRTPPTTQMFDRYLFTVGEVSRIRPQFVSSQLITIVQTLVAPSFSQLELLIPDKLDPNILQKCQIPVPSSVRAHAFLTLGKLCLENQALSKKCIAAFAREISTSPHPAVRNNVMVIMCDLCKKFTSLVDPHVTKLSFCLTDECELVRRQTLMLLTHLIQEDFVKWNTVESKLLFFRFTISLVDESPAIRQYANCCLVSLSQKKSQSKSNIFFNNFIETIFFLNDYRLHHIYNRFQQTEQERTSFSITGMEDAAQKRMSIYKVFLNHLKDIEKFELQRKLVFEILGAAADNVLPLDKARWVVEDALHVLTCEEIDCGNILKNGDDEEQEVEERERLVSAATGRMISKLQKKYIVEGFVPTIIEFKHLLANHHSPLLRTLMDYLKQVMWQYKDEIGDILEYDQLLAKEIQYDFRQHERGTTKSGKTKRQKTRDGYSVASADRPAREPSGPPVPKPWRHKRRLSASSPYRPAPAGETLLLKSRKALLRRGDTQIFEEITEIPDIPKFPKLSELDRSGEKRKRTEE